MGMRGYDRREVDELIAVVDEALASPPSSPARADALRQLREATFRPQFRGYSAPQVNQYIDDRIAELST